MNYMYIHKVKKLYPVFTLLVHVATTSTQLGEKVQFHSLGKELTQVSKNCCNAVILLHY